MKNCYKCIIEGFGQKINFYAFLLGGEGKGIHSVGNVSVMMAVGWLLKSPSEYFMTLIIIIFQVIYKTKYICGETDCWIPNMRPALILLCIGCHG